jgi:hypothetical protein
LTLIKLLVVIATIADAANGKIGEVRVSLTGQILEME